jgi:hypothetical protein
MSLEVVNKVDVAEDGKVSRKLLLSWPLSLTTTTTSTKREVFRGNMIEALVQASRPSLHFNRFMDASDSDTKGASNSELPLSFIAFSILPIIQLQTNAC